MTYLYTQILFDSVIRPTRVLVPVRFALALLHSITAGWPVTIFLFCFLLAFVCKELDRKKLSWVVYWHLGFPDQRLFMISHFQCPFLKSLRDRLVNVIFQFAFLFAGNVEIYIILAY